jgi:hypothetical protein
MIIPNIWKNKTCSEPPTKKKYIYIYHAGIACFMPWFFLNCHTQLEQPHLHEQSRGPTLGLLSQHLGVPCGCLSAAKRPRLSMAQGCGGNDSQVKHGAYAKYNNYDIYIYIVYLYIYVDII